MITNYDDLLERLDTATDTPYARNLEKESAIAIRTLQNAHQTEFEYRVLNGAMADELRAELADLKRDYKLNYADPMAVTCNTLRAENASLRQCLKQAMPHIYNHGVRSHYQDALALIRDAITEAYEQSQEWPNVQDRG